LSSTPDPTLAAPPEFPLPKGPGRDYSVESVLDLAGPRLTGRNFENGRAMYHSTACFSCHRFNGTGGGLGPDLTGAGSRYTLHDLVENIVDPSKVISDQYGSEEILLANGSTLVGRAYEEDGKLHVVFDPRNPEESESVALDQVRERHPYPVSLMPAGLLNSMNSNEVLDLLAYLLSGGNPQDPLFSTP
jgi:putative heme-binding domain-containing protein